MGAKIGVGAMIHRPYTLAARIARAATTSCRRPVATKGRGLCEVEKRRAGRARIEGPAGCPAPAKDHSMRAGSRVLGRATAKMSVFVT